MRRHGHRREGFAPMPGDSALRIPKDTMDDIRWFLEVSRRIDAGEGISNADAVRMRLMMRTGAEGQTAMAEMLEYVFLEVVEAGHPIDPARAEQVRGALWVYRQLREGLR